MCKYQKEKKIKNLVMNEFVVTDTVEISSCKYDPTVTYIYLVSDTKIVFLSSTFHLSFERDKEKITVVFSKVNERGIIAI